VPRRRPSDPDSLLGRLLRLAEKDIRALERRVRAAQKTARDADKPELVVMDAEDRKAMLATGEFLRKVSADLEPPDLSKMSDKELARLRARLEAETK